MLFVCGRFFKGSNLMQQPCHQGDKRRGITVIRGTRVTRAARFISKGIFLFSFFYRDDVVVGFLGNEHAGYEDVGRPV